MKTMAGILVMATMVTAVNAEDNCFDPAQIPALEAACVIAEEAQVDATFVSDTVGVGVPDEVNEIALIAGCGLDASWEINPGTVEVLSENAKSPTSSSLSVTAAEEEPSLGLHETGLIAGCGPDASWDINPGTVEVLLEGATSPTSSSLTVTAAEEEPLLDLHETGLIAGCGPDASWEINPGTVEARSEHAKSSTSETGTFIVSRRSGP